VVQIWWCSSVVALPKGLGFGCGWISGGVPKEGTVSGCLSHKSSLSGSLSPCASEMLTMDGCPQERPNLKAS